MAWLSITLCILATTNILTSCDARLVSAVSWDPTEDFMDSSLAPSAPPLGPTQPPTMVAHHPRHALWCVARPTVAEPMLQKAMDYACGFGADCRNILPSGSCSVPNSLFARASYAFNSFWQRTKINGGTCDFGATAMLITVDPSFDGCQFPYN